MQFGIQNWLLAVLSRKLFCLQELRTTKRFSFVAECMLLARAGPN